MTDEHKYDNAVYPDNKFGHTLELLRRNLGEDAQGAVYLDLACGFGHIADYVRKEFGVEYVGVDVDDAELEQLRERGYEAHALDLSAPDVLGGLKQIVAGRRLAAVTMLDGLEHMTEGKYVLAAIGALLAQHRALGVTSVPNVTHIDIGVKTLLGHWDYTPAGLLDDTHYTLYSRTSLEAAFREAGLRPIDKYDVSVAESDQHFPPHHVGLSPVTSFGQWVRGVRAEAEPSYLVQQFVWALTAAPRPRRRDAQEEGPFLSVLLRTQGRRPQELREALLCLAAQSCDDFEVLVLAHKTTYKEQLRIERIIADQPPGFRARIRLLLLDRGARSYPLNVGLAEARGVYVGIFDDDDTVLADWVEEFKSAARSNDGRILRGVTLRQDVDVVNVREGLGIRALDAPKRVYMQKFSLVEHVHRNESPPIGWVFPRSVYQHFGLTFDESMTTTEDWEFLIQAAQLTGVADIEKVLAIYRWWPTRESSRTLHTRDEWMQNEQEIRRRVDSRPLLLPAGDTRVIREKLGRLRELELTVRRQNRRLERQQARLERQHARIERQLARISRLEDQFHQAERSPVLAAARSRLRLRTRARNLYRRLGRN